jgi:hypothetical protein
MIGTVGCASVSVDTTEGISRVRELRSNGSMVAAVQSEVSAMSQRGREEPAPFSPMHARLDSDVLGCGEFDHVRIVAAICQLHWTCLSADEVTDVAWAYYHFSIQFRENLQIAMALYPDDVQLRKLGAEECNTDNLSPWPHVAGVGERLDHDEFIRRLLALEAIDIARRRRLTKIGSAYLERVRQFDRRTRAASIASFEDGGLERVFRAILTAGDWDGPLLRAFRHFLVQHIKFDGDPLRGHGALVRHLSSHDRIDGLWLAFERLLVESVPKLLS